MTKTNTGDRLQQSPLLKQGTVVGGRFVIKRFVAEGGMGRVYVAEQQPMGRKVALKVMRRDLSGDTRAVKRFFREAVVVSKLQHPNTITLFDYGEGEDGSLYIAMEFLDGLSLKEIVSHHKRLPVEKAARIVAQIGLSLAEAHRKGVIHRDLKPDNVFISEVDGQPDFVKVIDFGIAQLLTHDTESRITQAGFVCGTPEYMSPEQARGEELDGRCDLYSLGVMMYEMLEGKLPYKGDTPLAIVLKHQNGPVPLISEHYPQPMRAFVRRLMATARDDRPDNAEEMLRDLQRALPDGISLAGLDVRMSLPAARSTLRAATATTAPASVVPSKGPDTAEIAETLAEGSKQSVQEIEAGTSEIVRAARLRRGWSIAALGALALAIVAAVILLSNSGGETSGTLLTGTQASIAAEDDGNRDSGPPEERAGEGSGELAGAVEVRPSPIPERLSLTIASVPELARVHVDNVYYGVAPVTVELLPDVPFDLLLTLDGFLDLRETLTADVASNGQTLGPFELTPTPAQIEVSSRPSGAEVIEVASGESWGVTPLTQEVPRSTEPVEIELRLPRYQTETREIVPEREQIAIEVELRRARRTTSREDRQEREREPEPESEPDPQSPFGGTVD